jgi:ABC-2 type transport system permease protein
MKAIFNREFNSYFNNITGYIFSAFILLFAGIYVVALNLKGGMPNFEYALNGMSFIYLIVIPVLTMRSFAEERRQKTDQLLYSLPISTPKIVLGKYFAMLAVLIIPVAVLCFYPLILSNLGPVSLITAYGALVGFFLLGATLISMGIFVSSVTENQAVAAGLCIVLVLINYFIMDITELLPTSTMASLIALAVVILVLGLIIWLLTRNTTFSVIFTVACEVLLILAYSIWTPQFFGLFPAIVEQLSVFSRFYLFVNGIFDIKAIVYFISVIAVFLFLTVQSLEKRRWS